MTPTKRRLTWPRIAAAALPPAPWPAAPGTACIYTFTCLYVLCIHPYQQNKLNNPPLGLLPMAAHQLALPLLGRVDLPPQPAGLVLSPPLELEHAIVAGAVCVFF